MSKFTMVRLLSIILFSLLLEGCLRNKDEKTSPDTATVKTETPLSVNFPDSLKNVSQNKVDIEGTYSIESENIFGDKVDIKIGDIEATEITSTKYIFREFPLKLGKNDLEIKLYLNGVEKGSTKLSITYSDFYAVITTPVDGQVFRQGSTDVVGTFQYPKDTSLNDIQIKLIIILMQMLIPMELLSIEIIP